MTRIVLLMCALIMSACGVTRVDIREMSANFRDGRFHNINPTRMSSFWEVVWTRLTSDVEKAEWPERIETAADRSPESSVEGKGMRITYINHATFLIQVAGYNILTDPVFSERTSPFSFIGPKRIHKPGIDIGNLPPVDIILISHDHYDHLDLKSLGVLVHRDNPKIYTGLGVGSRFSNSENIVELDWWQPSQVADNFKIWFLDVQHFSGRSLTDRNTTLWGGYLLQIDGQQLYFGGDSGYAGHYQRTFDRFGAVDIALLPIGAYAPRHLFKPVHLDPVEAVQAH